MIDDRNMKVFDDLFGYKVLNGRRGIVGQGMLDIVYFVLRKEEKRCADVTFGVNCFAFAVAAEKTIKTVAF